MRVWEFQGEFRFLSNFWPAQVTLDGVTYPTVEHAYQAAKTLDHGLRRRISVAETPGKAKRLGKMGQLFPLRSDWNEVKVSIMADLLRQKFADPTLRLKLLQTGRDILCEGNEWHDNFWGSCQCPKCNSQGQNILGQILMAIRQELLQEEKG
jgi:ribA/ribD-fused uncharacterized protein